MTAGNTNHIERTPPPREESAQDWEAVMGDHNALPHSPGPWAIDRDNRPGMHWNNHIVEASQPHMTVCGQEDMPIPWDDIQAVFIGGSTEWKLSGHAAQVIRAAQALEKWVHAGRVNTPGRFEHFERLGVDSIDGTGLSRFSHMREAIHRKLTAPRLFSEEAAIP